MGRFNSPCSRCGEPTKETICHDCRPTVERTKIRLTHSVKPSAAARGYDSRWARLSKRARELQPFCIDCGSSKNLQADHSPATWARVERGLPLRLSDIEVVCNVCNVRRGAARGQNVKRK